MSRSRFRPFSLLLALAVALLPACSDDPVGPDIVSREVGVVVNSIDLSLTLFDVDDPASTQTVGLGADGSPVSLALRGDLAVVPMGIVPAAAVVDVAEGTLLRTVGLPSGSGATGAAFLNDSIALVANPGLNTVTPVNVLAGTAGDEIEVGRYPQAIVVTDGRAYVLNAELESFAPVGPSSITVIDGTSLAVVDTIELSGQNAAAGAVGPDGLIYVVHSGSFGAANGALSVVDPAAAEEVSFVTGFGEFPGSVAVDGAGRVFVGAFGVGTLVWDSATEAFVHGAADPVTPAGVASTSGLGIDSEGRVYALTPDCQGPAETHRLDDALEVAVSVDVGICPLAIGFAEIQEEL